MFKNTYELIDFPMGKYGHCKRINPRNMGLCITTRVDRILKIFLTSSQVMNFGKKPKIHVWQLD